jgi:hypothetical protein
MEASVLRKVSASSRRLEHFACPAGRHSIYYTRKLSWFVQVLDFIPEMTDADGRRREPSELKQVTLASEEERNIFLCALNATVFYWLLTVWSDCRNLNKREVLGLPLDVKQLDRPARRRLTDLAARLMRDFRRNSRVLQMVYAKWGTMRIQCIYPKHSKPMLDEIDGVLGRSLGFTEEELDFVVNCDLRYRLGAAADGDDGWDGG